ncbi:MAG TPA: L-histidine N(alpha)-methyltransferase [Acidisarcina sp.]
MIMSAPSLVSYLPASAYTPFGSEVFRGLTSRPKTLSPWLFYDAEGSRLFEKITALPEYYVTRTERKILAGYCNEMIAASGDGPLSLIELGAGTATKTGLLLRAALQAHGPLTYHAIDVSSSALEEAKRRIEADLPGVTVQTCTADYTEGLGQIASSGERRMVLYIGSSIGNFDPPDALRLLKEIRAVLEPGDSILLGVDLVKDRQVLLDAYDDAAGITAAFNKNVLQRINRQLGSNFNLQLFRHRSRWNEEQSRIEMHLESLITQFVYIPDLDLEVRLARGETIHTENSYKFTVELATGMLNRAGFDVVKCWSDPRGWFGEFLGIAR